MYKLYIPPGETYNNETMEFIPSYPAVILKLEHSLVSLSKWESKWKKPFLSNPEMTREESIDYIKCMTITQNVKPEVYYRITDEMLNEVNEYINDSMTATTFGKSNEPPSREIVTSELIYYSMIALNIPVEFQKWHLNRLLALIRVCNIKNTPPKKMSKTEIMNRNRALNQARRKSMHTKG